MGEYSIRSSTASGNDGLESPHNASLYSDASTARDSTALMLKHEHREDMMYSDMYVDTMLPWSTAPACCSYLPCLEDTVVASADGMLGYHTPCSATTPMGGSHNHQQNWQYPMPLPLVGTLPPYCEGSAVTPSGSQGHSGSMVALLAASVDTHSPNVKIPRHDSFDLSAAGLSPSASSMASSPAKESADVVLLPATPPTSPHKATASSVASTPSLATLSSPPSPKRRSKATRMIHPCQFPGCQKIFSRPYNLKSHMRTHSTERPFICHFAGCSWKFARPHDLKRHTLLHTGQKPHGCPYCDRRFGRSDALRRHWKASPLCAEAREQSLATTRAR